MNELVFCDTKATRRGRSFKAMENKKTSDAQPHRISNRKCEQLAALLNSGVSLLVVSLLYVFY